MRSLARFLIASLIVTVPASVAVAASGREPAAARSFTVPVVASVPSYYPHWVTRDGHVAQSILERLAPGTIVAAHHEWSLDEIARILDHPEKRFKISWYVEANVQESDDPTPTGTPVARRIGEARAKQDQLVRTYGAGRFANLIELNGSRDKKDGNLRGSGNRPADWMKDAETVAAAGFRYIAKSPALEHVDELRARFGAGFLPRIVFEDVTANASDSNPGYRRDARELAERGDTLTLIVHEGAYGGFPATSLAKARSVVDSDFRAGNVEMYWGRKTAEQGFVKVKSFEVDKGNDAAASVRR